MLKTIEINPGFAQVVDDNGGYCPCSIIKHEDTKCPCKTFRDQDEPGPCHCRRYEKVEV